MVNDGACDQLSDLLSREVLLNYVILSIECLPCENIICKYRT